ncbi:MAG: F0F1 ATP synthase subunit A [Planctomycetes bacterium]|nr:F0F1 ATP synthase subunit A [Planctomycetota bacterium]MBL7008957.1 F0F1 ATP synthase subunit A [Planctomycetota bacterium]
MNTPLVANPDAVLPSSEGGGGIFEQLFGHVFPHKVGEFQLFGTVIEYYTLTFFQVGAVLAVFLSFAGVAVAIRTNGGNAVQRGMSGFVSFIREEMVHPYLGRKDGDRMLPLFLSLFFFIMFQNLFGLFPGGATATASVYVSAALALITFATMIVGGMVIQGPVKFWLRLVPHVPGPLWPLMFVIELVGLCVKPFALTVRLTANMMGGHLVLLSFLGLVLYFGSMNPVAGWAFAPVGVGLSVFIMIIEGFVALLQAYIFTLLSIIFVGMCLHPDH